MPLSLGLRHQQASLADDGITGPHYTLRGHTGLSAPELNLLTAVIDQAVFDGDSTIHDAMGIALPLPRLSERAAAMLARIPRGVWFQPHELVEQGIFPDRVKLRTFLYNYQRYFEYRYEGRRRVWRLDSCFKEDT